MQKYLKNNIVIASALTFSCVILTVLYYAKGLVMPTFISFVGNILIMMLTILGVVICTSIFMLAIDSLFFKDIKFRERFFYITKSLWLSQLVILPISLILFIVNIFVNLEISIVNNIVVFSISYISQLVLFFSYRFITNRNWNIVIKVVAFQIIFTVLILLLLKLI